MDCDEGAMTHPARPRQDRTRAALALVLSCLPLAGQAACPPAPEDGAQVQQGGVLLAWRAAPAPRVGQPFVMTVQVCPADVQLLKVDATMPEHRHGMNYRPTLQPLGGGRWRVDGLLWHMAGRWELRWDLRTGPAADAPVQVLRASVPLQ
jgi:hypothetical protein